MIHTDLTMLKEPLQKSVMEALDEMRHDETLRTLGASGVEVSETLRELPTQMAYYSRGRMVVSDVQAMYKAAGLYGIGSDDAQKVVTWTLDSKHLRGEAVDLVPTLSGTPWWGAPDSVWNRMGAIGELHGLKWGGRWKNSDNPHFEI